MRLSIALALLTANLLFLANLAGFIPDKSKAVLEFRKSLCESMALHFSAAAEMGEFKTIQYLLRAVMERNEDIKSAAVRTKDGRLIALAGEHLAHWETPSDGKSSATCVQVPVFRKNEHWATVEMRFTPLWEDNLAGGLTDSFIGLLLFVAVGSFICYFFLLKRALRELDPSSVIPERVQKAFDVLQEGVLILDEKEQVVMANKSFAKLLGKPEQSIVGLKGSELGWLDYRKPHQIKDLPWFKVQQYGLEQKGTVLNLMNSLGKEIKLVVNATMVTDNAGHCRGTLVTFDDMTQLEVKNLELKSLVENLQLAQADIQSKTEELEFLADHDPLTLCLNRRSLDERLDSLFIKAKAIGTNLCCSMLDIDFFKSVNDRYGHATGDQVLREVADILKRFTRDADLVGRYGGEEFCVVLPKVNLQTAFDIAERIRQAIEKELPSGIKITVSQGVASLEFNASESGELIAQADKALYAAKLSGRNRVVIWGKDIRAVAESASGTERLEPVSQKEAMASTDMDKNPLRHRVQELEGRMKKQSLEFQHSAMYDSKTGLPTRSLFEDRIGVEINRSKRRDCMVAVASIRLDTIKQVEETLGYSVADQLAKDCGQRLSDALRKNIDTVALIEDSEGIPLLSQINQTEFGILLTDIQQVDHVTWVIKRLLVSLEEPFLINGNEIYISCYVGVSIFPDDGQTAEELYRSAANACSHTQKLKGKDRWSFSSPRLNEMAANQLKLENSLRQAIKNDELQLHYQPKIETASGRIAGFEALLRWKNAHLGYVPPNIFVPVAEHSGQIATIGEWVLLNACKQLKTWLEMGLNVGSIAINLSGVELLQKNMANRLQKVLDQFNLESHLLEIELTESTFASNYDGSFSVLKQIKELGVRVTLDDFGTGYSSLHCLRNIPLSCLKIDRSFVSDINKDESANKLITAIVSIAHELGLEVVAEGVEKKYQADYLISLGCEYLQGYYFCRPIPQNEVVHVLQKQPMLATVDESESPKKAKQRFAKVASQPILFPRNRSA